MNKANFLMTVGERIKTYRTQRIMTPKAIAADLKISPQAYGDIERGKTDVHLSRILQISQALDVLPQELVSIESAY